MSGKTIPSTLQDHYDLPATTTCLLVRIAPVIGTVTGFTDLDQDIEYDDGDGVVTYRADNGFTPARFDTSADMSVDNTEGEGWVSDDGITMAQIRAGFFRAAEVKVYRINYMDLTNGHEVLLTGNAGETTFSKTGWRTEFLSLINRLKQPISKLYSITCRAQFGDADCGKSFTWVSGSVTAVGSDNLREFTDSALVQADDYFFPGVIEWLTGDNDGMQMEVDSHESDSFVFSLPMPYPIQIGDTYRVRQDCNKVALGDCKVKHNNLVNFRGENLIPVADGGASMIPGARINRK